MVAPRPASRIQSLISRGIQALQAVRGDSSTPELGSLRGATAWLNSAPLTPADLRGKVVIVQFWTYTCIEWLGTLPYVTAWWVKYARDGLVVIGVHTPEHSFERDIENVRRAVNGLGIRYPIAIDNHAVIWEAFKRPYSPTLFVVDARMRIRHQVAGDAGYAESEQVIRQLLTEAGDEPLTH